MLSPEYSAFESTLNSRIVLYHINPTVNYIIPTCLQLMYLIIGEPNN